MTKCIYTHREKVELSDDIKAKQELVQQRQAEMEVFQEDVSQASRQRQGLEQEREQAQNLLEQLNTEVNPPRSPSCNYWHYHVIFC